jgi:hypothetical protein
MRGCVFLNLIKKNRARHQFFDVYRIEKTRFRALRLSNGQVALRRVPRQDQRVELQPKVVGDEV